VLIGFILIALIFIFISVRLQQQKSQATQTVVAVAQEDLAKEAIRTGQVELQGVIQVTSPITGVITTLEIENDQLVKKDQPLFTIKSTASQAEKAQALASLLAAKNNYQEAQISTNESTWSNFESAKQTLISIERQIEIFENERPSERDSKDYHALKASEAAARHNLNLAEKMTATVEDRLKAARASQQAAAQSYQLTQDTTYLSPIDGVIQNIGVNVGENVLAGVGDKAGTPLFLIVPDAKKTVSIQIGPTDAALLRIGQNATVRADAYPGATFSASIARIDKVGKQTDRGLTYRAWLKLDDPADQLLLGIPVEATIVVDSRSQVLTLPQQAVVNNVVVLTNKNKDVLETRPVVTGLKAASKIEIITGLQVGDLVLITP
jgi:RND family efflux transporter MFP subunit